MPIPIGLALTLIGVPLFILTLRLQALHRTDAH
jgi:iron complex transport system permease protein